MFTIGNDSLTRYSGITEVTHMFELILPDSPAFYQLI